jgi:hypothetical protein
MAKYLVTVPVTGTADFIVEADNEDEAKEKVLEKMLNGNYSRMEGNALDIDRDSNTYDVEDVTNVLLIGG